MNALFERARALLDKNTYIPFLQSLRYSLYVITHPADGFWDLTHDKRGSMAAAHFIVVLTLLTQLWRLQFTSFLFVKVNWERVNIFMECASFLFPLLVFCVCNWGVTTLFDGKGRLKDVYMATAYALVPYPLIQIPLIFLSNAVTGQEGTFYLIFSNVSLIWSGILIVVAMMMIHVFTLRKTLLFLVATIFAMLVVYFILLLFFSMISDGVAYFVSLGREIIYRLN